MASKVRKKCHYICKTNIVYGVFRVDIHFGPKTNDFFYLYSIYLDDRLQVFEIQRNLQLIFIKWVTTSGLRGKKRRKYKINQHMRLLLQIGRKKNLIILKRKVFLLTINTTVCYPLSTIHNNVEMKTSWGDFSQ